MIQYIIITFLLFLLELVYFRIADKFNIIDKPNQRSSHTTITLRGGGILFYLGMILYAAFFGFAYPWFLLGLTLIALISFADDIRPLSSKVRLVFHFSAMALMFYQWGMFGMPWWYIAIALIFCTGIINAYNFMDGINGITGGYSLAVLLPLIYLNRSLNFIDPNLLYVATLSVLVFNFFNFRKRAKCFAGDVGSVSIAFIILFALGKLILETQNLTYMMLLAIYGVDSVLTIIHRIMLGEQIMQPHRKHAYQLMANELKIPHVVVSSFYMVLQLTVSVGLFVFADSSWTYAGISLLILALGYIGFKRKYFYLHQMV